MLKCLLNIRISRVAQNCIGVSHSLRMEKPIFYYNSFNPICLTQQIYLIDRKRRFVIAYYIPVMLLFRHWSIVDQQCFGDAVLPNFCFSVFLSVQHCALDFGGSIPCCLKPFWSFSIYFAQGQSISCYILLSIHASVCEIKSLYIC